MLDSCDEAFAAQVEPAAGLGLRNLRIERAPLGAGLAALCAEALLDAKSPAVARPRIDRHIVGVHALVTQAPRTGMHHLEIVRGGQARIAVAARDSEPLLGHLVPAFELVVVDRPVGERGSGYVAIDAARAQLVGLQARCRGGPVHRGAAHRAAVPGRERRRILHRIPGAALRARFEPGELSECFARVLRESRERLALARLEQHDLEPAARQLIGHGAAAGTRTHDDHDVRVVELETRHEPLIPTRTAARRCLPAARREATLNR